MTRSKGKKESAERRKNKVDCGEIKEAGEGEREEAFFEREKHRMSVQRATVPPPRAELQGTFAGGSSRDLVQKPEPRWRRPPGRPTCLGVASLSQLTLHAGLEFRRAPAPGVTCRVRGVEQGSRRAGSRGRWKAKVSAARKGPAGSPASAASANQREAQAALSQSEAAVPPVCSLPPPHKAAAAN